MRQDNLIKNNDTPKQHTIIVSGSTGTVQREDSRPWMHGTIAEHGDERFNGYVYKICITKAGRVVMRNVTHIRQTPIYH